MDKPKTIVEIPFHGEDVEGMEAVRLKLVACSNCGGFDFMIAARSEIPGDLQGFICSKCRHGLEAETIAISVFEQNMKNARLQYVKAFNAMKIYRFGFMAGAAFIFYQTFFG